MGRLPGLTGTVLAALLSTPLAAQHQQHEKPPQLAPGYSALGFALPAAGSYTLPPMGTAADAEVLDSQGKSRRIHDFLGDRIVLLSFIYTSCSDVNGCPLASSVLRIVQEQVRHSADLEDRVRLISFSFDPQYDTPARLREYSSHFLSPGFDWQFLTSPSPQALAPVLAAYNQWVIRDYDADGNYLGTMSHLLRVYLIDCDMRIRNIYSTSFLHADTVANDIRTLLAEEHRE